jgi:hypothetical protein
VSSLSATVQVNTEIEYSSGTGPGPAPGIIPADLSTRQIRRKPVLSGLINEYQRAA